MGQKVVVTTWCSQNNETSCYKIRELFYETSTNWKRRWKNHFPVDSHTTQILANRPYQIQWYVLGNSTKQSMHNSLPIKSERVIFVWNFFSHQKRLCSRSNFEVHLHKELFYPSQLEGKKGKVDLARTRDIKNYVKIFYPVAAVNIQSGRHKCCSQMSFFVGQLAKVVWETVRVFSGECTFYVLSPCSNRNNNAMCKFNTLSISLENGNMHS